MVFDDKGLTRLVKGELNASRVVGSTGRQMASPSATSATLLSKFIESFNELEAYKNGGESVRIDGRTLSIAAVTAAARCGAHVSLNDSTHIQERVAKSRHVIAQKVESGASVYGLSTGFGGSADTRTNEPILLGKALLQHQQAGVLPTRANPPEILPLLDPESSLSMSESWVRGAMLIRANSLIRGHSGVRWELIEKISELLNADITPLVPMRGSISASGDLSPLSYIAGTIVGNPSIRVFDGPRTSGVRKIRSSRDALNDHHIEPLTLASKEPLGILNGTAFSASVAALALHDAVQLAILSQVCTAMGVEALLGSKDSFHPFIHVVARPHHGQVECARNIASLLEGSSFAQSHEEEVTLEEDKYSLRQDRYPLRTSPQFLGPQLDDLLSAFLAVTQECNSTTDNPLIDGSTGTIHHGGNFQAMAVTNAMEKARVALHHVGKLLFAQCTELTNPAMNNGLPPSLAASNPSLDYHCKGADIATAAYVAELGYLANPVSTHIQSAEMHNQAINSLALISARATVNSLQVLSLLVATYLYALCQALDLRSMRLEFNDALKVIVTDELAQSFGDIISAISPDILVGRLLKAMHAAFDKSTTMDAADQMNVVAASSTTILVDFFSSQPSVDSSILSSIFHFRSNVSARGSNALDQLRTSYLKGERGASPASAHLGKTRSIYEFIRLTLGIKMHGGENHFKFSTELGDNDTIGQQISMIYDAIRDGKFQKVMVDIFA